MASAEQKFHMIDGDAPNNLANAISDAIHAALETGMRVDDATCVVVGVAADYARDQYGDSYLDDMTRVLLDRKGRPLPFNLSSERQGNGS